MLETPTLNSGTETPITSGHSCRSNTGFCCYSVAICGFLHFLFTLISHLLQVNFVSYVQMATAALPVLETSGGSIIVVSSVAGESLTLLVHIQLILI